MPVDDADERPALALIDGRILHVGDNVIDAATDDELPYRVVEIQAVGVTLRPISGGPDVLVAFP